MKVWNKMKHDLTTGTWQDDTGCPISIVLAATSDAPLPVGQQRWQHGNVNGSPW